MKVEPGQATVLEALGARQEPISLESLAEQLEMKPETVTGIVFTLEEDGLATVDERKTEGLCLTDEGSQYESQGLPELRLLEAAIGAGADDEPVSLGGIVGQLGDDIDVDIALSNLARKEYGAVSAGELRVSVVNPADEEADALAEIAAETSPGVEESVIDRLEHRNLVERRSRTDRYVTLTETGRNVVADGLEVTETVDRVTPELLTSGDWEDVEFTAYNVAADPPRHIGGSEHPLRRMAEWVKDVLIGMGFEEMEGPHVDADFWINDCLFMPQDHPARTHWDRFELAEPARIEELPTDLVERVERAHREGVGEHGEGYHAPWEEDFARALALRGHTTSLSARHLAGEARGDLEPPQRFFSVEKAYRNDTIDATHLLEFFQIEGWVMAESLSVRDLMGTFTEFYEHFGITDIEFKPHYNPYTEPSFELFGVHPETDELMEIGNSGIFRPEMLEPLGVDCDVMAWGLALERLMMLVSGAEDIRDVHGTLVDLEYLRETEVVY